jgi:hypothetical protein
MISSNKMDQEPLLNRKEAARYLCSLGYTIRHTTLAIMASNNNAGKGPPFLKFGWSQVKYRRSELDAWAHSRMREVR